MTNQDVVIAGGGPTGLMLAAELALAGIEVVVVERRATQDLAGSRAGGLHARTLEVLDQRGVAERFVAEGQRAQVAAFAMSTLDISDFPTRRNYGLGLWQNAIERILAQWVAELGVTILRSREVTGFTQDEEGVDVTIAGDAPLRAKYLVGCDGGRSVVRKHAGIDFVGWDPSTSYLLAEADLDEEPPRGLVVGEKGLRAIGRIGDGKRARIVLEDPELVQDDAPTFEDLRAALVVAYGTDFGLRHATWITRFSDMARQATAYRSGRVLLAGDAAHVHSPVGGQGLNLGVQDAINLGWKLAQVVRGWSGDRLLDSYHAERHPVAASVLRSTMAQTAIRRGDAQTAALREVMGELLKLEEPRKLLAGRISGLEIRYDLGEGHPLLGRRMPDLDVVTEAGPQTVYTWLHDARPLLLRLAGPGTFDASRWADRVRSVVAHREGPWELPVLGVVPRPTAVLVRPDGYVAWVGEAGEEGLGEALTRWFGEPPPLAPSRDGARIE